jgi:hypothetical protein
MEHLTFEQAILKALEGLLLPPLRQLVVEYYELSPKRKDELAKLIPLKNIEKLLAANSDLQHEMECFLPEWIKPYSRNTILPDNVSPDNEVFADPFDAVVISPVIRSNEMDSIAAEATVIRGNSMFLVRHLGTGGLSLDSALRCLLSPNNRSPWLAHPIVLTCLPHGHQGPTRCSKCIGPLFWYLCKLYNCYDVGWQTVFENLVGFDFLDLATLWINRNREIARNRIADVDFSFSVVQRPDFVPFVELCQTLQGLEANFTMSLF